MALDSHLDSHLANLSLSEIASLLSPKQQEVLLASISVAASLIQQIQQEDSMTQQRQQQQQQYQQEQPQQLTTQSPQQQLNTHHQQLTAQQLTTSHHHHLLSHTQTKRESHLSSKSTTSATSCYDEDDELSDEADEEESHDFQNHTTNSTTATTCYGEGHDADEKDLLTIRQFAEELKSRRKAIRLSQKGAAQSLRAFTGGAQPCTDAIIYHFENLQLEPERAMQLIPLLTDWLEWAEKHRYNGKQLPMMSAVTKVPRERKRKVVLFNEKAKQHLEDEFSKNNHPDRYQLDVISHELDIPTRSIRKWFTNRRQRKRFAEKFLPALSPEQ